MAQLIRLMTEKYGKIAQYCALAALAVVLWSSAMVPVAKADCVWDLTTGDFTCGETEGESVSFTDFQGGLDAPDESEYDDGLTQATSAREFILNVVNFALAFLGLIAVVVIIYAGFLYVTAHGEEGQTGKAKKAIFGALIGIVLILGSFALVNTIIREAARGGQDIGDGGATADTDLSQFESDVIETFDVEAIQAELQSITSSIYNENLNYVAIETTIDELEAAVNGFDDYATQEAEITADYNAIVASYTDAIDPLGALRATAEAAYEVALEDLEDSVQEDLEAINLILEDLTTQVSQFSETYERVNEFSNDLDDFYAYREPHTQWTMIPKAQAVAASAAADVSIIGSVASILILDDYECEIAELTLETITKDVLQPCVEGLNDSNVYDFGEEIEIPIETLTNLQSLFEPENDGYAIFDTAVEYAKELQQNPINDNLRTFVNAIGTIYNAVSKMSITKPKIAVDVASGNAPLVVNFNGLGSSDANFSDETNQTLTDSQYEWDLDGDGHFNNENNSNTDTCNEATGAAVTCTYMEAGTYRAALRVVSNDAENVISGVTYFNIKVEPSTATIKLIATLANGEDITLIDETGAIPVNRTSYKFTLSEAQAGITFDLSGSTGTNDNEITKVNWDFGDGTKEETEELSLAHAYGEEGKYQFKVTVTDTSGSVNNEVIELYVASPAARIIKSADNTNLIVPVSFDGATSATDLGSIVAYEWEILNEETSATETIADPSAVAFDHTFSTPGIYDVSLTVTDSTNKTDTTTETVLVESQAPEPCFTSAVPLTTQPGTYILNASCSADPDPGDTLSFEWALTGTEGTDWEFVDGTASSENPSVQFLKVGSYDVTLTAKDQYTDDALQKTATTNKTISVDSILDIDVEADVVGAVLEEGQATVTFTVTSAVATGFDIDYNDGESDSVANAGGTVTQTHTYTAAGHFEVRVTAYTDDGDENYLTEHIFVGDGIGPIAVPVILVNSQEVQADETSGAYTGTRADTFTFDASNSLNGDGDKRGLTYSWNFGDGGVSTQKTVTHKYKDTGDYTAKLVVTDREGVSDEAEIAITIEGQPPSFESMMATPRSTEFITPLSVTVSLIGADDPDGTISQYTWWYYDTSNSSEKIGQTTTSGNTAILTINTNGLEGEEHTYGFGVSLKDNEGNTVSSETVLSEDAVPTLTVTNGSNEVPTLSLSADRTSIYTGDTIAFTANADDADGTIASYEWDLGTGTFSSTNGSGTAYGATVNQTFTSKNTSGLKIRVRVTDDGGATAEDSLIIYVDSNSNPPEAAFLSSADKKVVTFTNNSSADSDSGATIAGYEWDFNTSADTDGNGTRNDDVDSTDASPSYTYSAYGSYTVQLTVTDSNGETDKVTQTVTLTQPDVTLDAKLTSSLDDAENGSTIVITGDSGTVTFDTSSSEGEIALYWIDGNVYYDSDKNGATDDDHDYESTTSGTWSSTYKSSYGQIMAKLTVEDEDGNKDYVTRAITFDTTSTGSTDVLRPEMNGALLIVAVLLLSGIVILIQEGVFPVSLGGGKRGRHTHTHKK